MNFESVNDTSFSFDSLMNLMFLNSPIWDEWDFREDERYLIEIIGFVGVIGEKRMANLLAINERELRTWISSDSISKMSDGKFMPRVYLVCESWVCLKKCFSSDLHSIKQWLFTPQTIMKNCNKQKPINHLVDYLELIHSEFLIRANIVFVRNYQRFSE